MFEHGSGQLGYLEVGEEICTFRAMRNAAGQTRVRFARGWASLHSAKDGGALLLPVDDPNTPSKEQLLREARHHPPQCHDS